MTKVDYIDLLGKPFAWGGRGPDAYDCYGLCIELLRRAGKHIPDAPHPHEPAEIDSAAAINARQFEKVADPQQFDLVLFSIRPPFVSHIGVMVTNYEFIHICANSSVTRERIDSLQWQKKVAGYYRWND